MDINIGELVADSFLTGVGIVLAGVWQGLLDNPWLFVLFGGIIVASLWMQLRPRRRRRRY